MENKYAINTGYIFQCLWHEFKKYDRHFLNTVVQDAFHSFLFSKKHYSVTYNGSNADYLSNYALIRYPRDIEHAENIENFPFPNYFLCNQPGSPYLAIIEFDNPIEITKEEYGYDLFFALQLSLTDIMEVEEFLQYHLVNTFENDCPTFKIYLENICLKYKEFLGEKYAPLIQRFLTKQETIIEPIKEGNKEFTTARQVLAITYLLDELKINRHSTSLTEIAKFIQFLSGKEAGSAKINDTTIYKRVKSPLTKTDKTAEKDLQFIRTYFEKLGLQSIVNKINKEIGSKE